MTDIIQQQWSTLAAHKQAEFYKAGSNLLTKITKCVPMFFTSVYHQKHCDPAVSTPFVSLVSDYDFSWQKYET